VALACDPDELGEREEPATADVEGLRRFLEGKLLPWFENRRKELANRPLIREQAFGEALDPDKLIHLDRKLERMLTMLLRLKDLRRTTVRGLIRFAKASTCLSRRMGIRASSPTRVRLLDVARLRQ
jgi:hypothetical protein